MRRDVKDEKKETTKLSFEAKIIWKGAIIHT